MSQPDPLDTAEQLLKQARGQLDAALLLIGQAKQQRPKASEPQDFGGACPKCGSKKVRRSMGGDYMCLDCGKTGTEGEDAASDQA